MSESNAEYLESFREQWRREVSARSGNDSTRQDKPTTTYSSRLQQKPPRSRPGKASERVEKADEQESHSQYHFDNDQIAKDTQTNSEGKKAESGVESQPQSALEHYEKAVERESQGSLGDSLHLYRKAFKMDDRVDLKYKNKHFPASSFASKNASKPTNTNPPNAPVTVPNTAHHSLSGPPLPMRDLIAGFSTLSIEPAPPEIEDTPAPPCPISLIPDELLAHILMEVAIADVASFVRLASVCKRLAYLVLTEETIWKRICIGQEVGFAAMHYSWNRDLSGGPLLEDFEGGHVLGSADDYPADQPTPRLEFNEVNEILLRTAYASSWYQMFRARPRIRFNGCYISTVNYIRPGQASVTPSTWSSQVHIVTYYRYLRFFRDGTCISLLTTTEPAEVVHELTKSLLNQIPTERVAKPITGTSLIQQALRGRWKLSSANDHLDDDIQPKDAEGDVIIETEGVGPKYIYRMELSLRSVGKGAKNNKMVWKGFWNYNKLTDDWAEFGLRNDKAFFWSRVKSYGAGE